MQNWILCNIFSKCDLKKFFLLLKLRIQNSNQFISHSKTVIIMSCLNIRYIDFKPILCDVLIAFLFMVDPIFHLTLTVEIKINIIK